MINLSDKYHLPTTCSFVLISGEKKEDRESHGHVKLEDVNDLATCVLVVISFVSILPKKSESSLKFHELLLLDIHINS